MKKTFLIFMIGLLSVSCNGQKNEENKGETIPKQEEITKNPKGNWKVNKEFDENGNLIRYDSIYTYSSNGKFKDLSSIDKDSLLNSFESGFYKNFSQFKNQGFEKLFAQDSLFGKQFFNNDFFDNDFGKDFMDIDKIRQQMIERQKKFLEKYQSEFMKPKIERKNKN